MYINYVICTTVAVVYILIIFIALFLSWNIIEKTLSWPRGDLNPRRWYQSTGIGT